jgi:hypothetical protein
VAVRIFTNAIQALLMQFKEWFSDDKEREEFGEKVIAEFQNPTYHLYSPMFVCQWNRADLEVYGNRTKAKY